MDFGKAHRLKPNNLKRVIGLQLMIKMLNCVSVSSDTNHQSRTKQIRLGLSASALPCMALSRGLNGKCNWDSFKCTAVSQSFDSWFAALSNPQNSLYIAQ
jgi:hypothetical protein